MDQLVAKLNCRACGNTHYGLWSKDEGETVECPIESVVVATATGQVVVEEEPRYTVERGNVEEKIQFLSSVAPIDERPSVLKKSGRSSIPDDGWPRRPSNAPILNRKVARESCG